MACGGPPHRGRISRLSPSHCHVRSIPLMPLKPPELAVMRPFSVAATIVVIAAALAA